MPGKKTIMSKIVSDVRQPAACYDVRKCHARKLGFGQGLDGADGGFRDAGRRDGAETTLKKGRLSRLVGTMSQIWARMKLGETAESAIGNVYANTRRGALKLAKADPARAGALLGPGRDAAEAFDTLKTGIACGLSDDGRFSCDRDSMERLARVSWFSRFQWNLEAGLATAEPIESIVVDGATAERAMSMLETVMLAVDGSGGITDHRRRGYGPAGTRTISYWEYELCSRDVVWVTSYAGTLSNSRISAWMVATYFFLLDSGQFARDELAHVGSIGCIDPLTGECMTIGFDEIDEASARNTMELVNGYGPGRIEELAGASDPGVRMSVTASRAPRAAAATPKREAAAVGRVKAPSRQALEDHLAANGRASLYSYVAATVGQPRGGTIPPGCFERVMDLGDASAHAGSGDVRVASYLVPAMLRFAYTGYEDREAMFARQYLGARALDAAGADVTPATGMPGFSAVEYLERLLGECYGNADDLERLAVACAKINAFGKYGGNREVEIGSPEIGIAENEPAKEDVETSVVFFERAARGIEKLGGAVTAIDFECAPSGNRYIATAKAPYLTGETLIRLSFGEGMPRPTAIMTDAVTRHFGIEGGLLGGGITMGVVNPRTGTACVLPTDKLDAVSSVAAEAAAPFEPA